MPIRLGFYDLGRVNGEKWLLIFRLEAPITLPNLVTATARIYGKENVQPTDRGVIVKTGKSGDGNPLTFGTGEIGEILGYLDAHVTDPKP